MAVVNNSNALDVIIERNHYLTELKISFWSYLSLSSVNFFKYFFLLTEIYSSLVTDDESLSILNKLKSCLKYLETFSSKDIHDEVLQWLMPGVNKCLTKVSSCLELLTEISHIYLLQAFSENVELSDTTNDEFILIIFRQNLMVCMS